MRRVHRRKRYAAEPPRFASRDEVDHGSAGDLLIILAGCALIGTAGYFLFREGGPLHHLGA